MAAITAAAIGTAATVYAIKEQRDAAKDAAKKQEVGARSSAELLDKSGAAAEKDIYNQSQKAADIAKTIPGAAGKYIEPFANMDAVQKYMDNIIGNLQLSGPMADQIRQGAIQAVQARPEFNLSGKLGGELGRQADLAVGAATPDYQAALGSAAQQGLAGAVDLSGINQRGVNRLGNLAGSAAVQRSNVLLGQAPALADLTQTRQEAGLLSSVAGQQARTQGVEALSELAGTVYQNSRGVNQPKTNATFIPQGNINPNVRYIA